MNTTGDYKVIQGLLEGLDRSGRFVDSSISENVLERNRRRRAMVEFAPDYSL